MKKEIRNYTVVILGDTYTIASDEPEEHVAEAANYVHVLMQEYMSKAPHIPLKTVAIFAALKLASTVLQHEAALQAHADKQGALLLLVEGQIKRSAIQE
jgi:cell division protein ZapA (FtsZ GTPase activity inhibitor)